MRWVAEIVTDRQLFERVSPDGLAFPEAREVVTLDLTEAELLIGRRHERRGIEPAIDLSGPLEDPAASHRHAVLTRLDDGAYALADLDSTNGTELNDGRVAIEAGRPHRLADGDRIHIGVDHDRRPAFVVVAGWPQRALVAAISVVGPSWPGMSTTSSW